MTDPSEDSPFDIHPASVPDYMQVPQMRELQLSRLRSTVRRAYLHVELYRQRMDKRSVRPEDMRTLDDVNRLPFTVARMSLKAGSSSGAPTVEVIGLGVAPARSGQVSLETPTATVEHVELNGL